MWYIKEFDELSLNELEQIFRLRQSIFILEQKSYFEDIDGKDSESIHIFSKNDGYISSYCRVTVKDNIVLGRVTVHIDFRKNGKGREMLNYSLKYLEEKHPDKDIEIVAMSYLRKFYQSFGFITTSDIYIMDGDQHENMILKR